MLQLICEERRVVCVEGGCGPGKPGQGGGIAGAVGEGDLRGAGIWVEEVEEGVDRCGDGLIGGFPFLWEAGKSICLPYLNQDGGGQ
jgi:hypothetical protein